MAIKPIYTLFLSLLIALFVGLGINAFYEGPKSPEYPIELQTADQSNKFNCEETVEIKKTREDFAQAEKAFAAEFKIYNRDVSIISLIAAIIILVLSLTLLSKINMNADGLLLGGVFSTAYSIIRSMMSQNSQFRFIIVVIGLAITLVLGYIKFIRPKAKLKKA